MTRPQDPTDVERALARHLTDHYSLREGDLFGRSRTSRVCLVRHLFAYGLRLLGYSYPEIGRVLRRDHTTVMSGIKKIEHPSCKGAREGVALFLAQQGHVRMRVVEQMSASEALEETSRVKVRVQEKVE